LKTGMDFHSILMPSYPTKKLCFSKYVHLGKEYKLFQGEFINNCCNQREDPYLYYIVSGKMQLCFERADGSILSIAQRETGNAFQAEYCGYASISDDKLKFIAQINSVLVSFSKQQIFELLKVDDQLLEDFLYIVHMTYATFAQRLMNTASLHSSQRLLAWLDKLCKTVDPDAQGHFTIRCNLTQKQIADLLFIHVTTCNKLIAGLEKEKIIEKTKSHICVYDSAKIKEYLAHENKIIC